MKCSKVTHTPWKSKDLILTWESKTFSYSARYPPIWGKQYRRLEFQTEVFPSYSPILEQYLLIRGTGSSLGFKFMVLGTCMERFILPNAQGLPTPSHT